MGQGEEGRWGGDGYFVTAADSAPKGCREGGESGQACKCALQSERTGHRGRMAILATRNCFSLAFSTDLNISHGRDESQIIRQTSAGL